MHGPSRIFWASLTTFSPQLEVKERQRLTQGTWATHNGRTGLVLHDPEAPMGKGGGERTTQPRWGPLTLGKELKSLTPAALGARARAQGLSASRQARLSQHEVMNRRPRLQGSFPLPHDLTPSDYCTEGYVAEYERVYYKAG